MSFPRYERYKDSGVEWLGNVPEGWDVLKFRRCVDIAEGQVNPEVEPYLSMPLLAPNHIESGTGRVLTLETAEEQGAISGKYLCKAGDVVYSKIRPALRKVCIASDDCLCSADMYPLRAHSGLTNGFLLWFILSEPFSAFAVLESDRVAMPKINRESLKEVMLAVPSLEEQSTIVAVLGQETSKIDALVADKERLIVLLQEKRQAVISHAVTKGLKPDAPMKDSGVEWLGKVPEHWKPTPMKYLVRLQSGGTPSKENLNYWNGAFPWASAKDMKSEFLTDTQDHITEFAIQNGVTTLLEARTVLVVVRGMILARTFPVALTRERMAINQDLKAVIPGDRLIPEFLALYLRGTAEQSLRRLDEAGHGTKALRMDEWTSLEIALPPKEEQSTIVNMIYIETTKIDCLVMDALRVIDLLKERRSALISAAVTGKIDVKRRAGGTPC